ncbi:unnamed protein product [Polarella glacialis]|uniref:Ion transport domain-containing protein n=1 Tax=Polarella glacialis TaxID=89957 RepID=A0A813GUY8_POLGL|nr:unnamed protein product [Polarella glacialis]
MAAPSANSGYVELKEEDVGEAAARTEGVSQSVGSRTFVWNGWDCTGTDLHIAALEGDASAAQLALDSQPGTVKAIHLAASRGHVTVVKLLMAEGADVSTCMNGKLVSHDVLHAAMFQEEGGGSETMIQYLLEGTPKVRYLHKNTDGNTPLHVAYMQGNVPGIDLMRRHLVEVGLIDKYLNNNDGRQPLEIGIRAGRMTQVQLSQGAEPSTLSLSTFIHSYPQCIPFFLDRLEGSAFEVVRNLESGDQDWNFGRRGLGAFFNPQNNRITLYQKANKDVDIRVCHVPDLLTAKCFSALCAGADDDRNMPIFESDVIQSLVLHVFMNHSAKVEFVEFLLSFWALGCLLYQVCAFQGGSEHELETGTTAVAGYGPAVQFVAARGVVDLIMEMFEQLGLKSIGRWSDYYGFHNLADVLFAFAPMYLFINPHCRLVLAMTIFLCWARLLGIATCIEFVGQELQPFRNLVQGLLPALLVTGLASGSFTHVLYTLRGGPFKQLFHESFTLLVTASLPKKSEADMLEIVFLYGAVLFFTTFVLNIFFEVIGEQYEKEKGRCELTFRRLRAKSCLRFLLRVRVMPCLSCPLPCLLMFGSCATTLGIQAYSFNRDGLHGYKCLEGAAYVACQGLLIFASFHTPDAEVLAFIRGETKEARYLWVCKERSKQAEQKGRDRTE